MSRIFRRIHNACEFAMGSRWFRIVCALIAFEFMGMDARAQTANDNASLTISRSGEDQGVFACYLAQATRRVEGDALVGTLHIQNLSGTWIYLEQDATSSVTLPNILFLLGPGADLRFDNFRFPRGTNLYLKATTLKGVWGLPVSDPRVLALEYAVLSDLALRAIFNRGLEWDFYNNGALGVVEGLSIIAWEELIEALPGVHPELKMNLLTALRSVINGEQPEDTSLLQALQDTLGYASEDESFSEGISLLTKGAISTEQAKTSLGIIGFLLDAPEKIELVNRLIAPTRRSAAISALRLEVVAGSPEPTIVSLAPSGLRTMPLGQLQTLIVTGTGFTNASRLSFSDGVKTYPDRVPTYINPTELRYDIAVGPNPATWLVRVTNGTILSTPATFSVTAATGALQSLTIYGQGFLAEKQSSQYTARAFFADGSSSIVPASWSVSGMPSAQMSSTGLLSIGVVNASGVATLAAGYMLDGVVKSASFAVAVAKADSPAGSAGSYYLEGPGLVTAGSTSTYALKQIQSNGTSLTVVPARWDSSDASLLSLNSSGQATATGVLIAQTLVTVFAYMGNPGSEVRVDKAVTLTPAPGSNYFEITVVESSSGTVSFEPEPEISNGKMVYRAGQIVAATAIPSGGYLLSNWGESSLTENPYVFTMTGNRQLRPNFVAATVLTEPKTLIVDKPAGFGRMSIASPSVGQTLAKEDTRFVYSSFAPQERVNSTVELSPSEEFLGWIPNNSQGPSARTNMVDHYHRIARIRSRLASSPIAERTRRIELRLGGGFIEDGYLSSFENNRYVIDNGMFLRMTFSPAPRPGLTDSYADAYLKIPDFVMQTMPRAVTSAQIRFRTTNSRGAMKLMLPDRDISIPSSSSTTWSTLPNAIDFGSPIHEYFAINSELGYDITGQFNRWRSGEQQNFGLIMRATTNYRPEIASSNDIYFERRPVLVLEWIEDAAPPAPPIVTSESAAQTVLQPDGAVRLGVETVSDGTVTYQWDKDGATIMGANSPEYFVSGGSEPGTGTYTLTMSNPQGVTTRQFTVHSPPQSGPSVLKQPESLSIMSGDRVSFVASMGGSAPLFLQWFKDGIPMVSDGRISGVIGARLVIDNVISSDAGAYHFTATNSLGTVTSTPATLTVVASSVLPVFTTQPLSLMGDAGGSARLWVEVAGIPRPSLQWYRNGIPIPRATGTELLLSSLGREDGGYYYVDAINAAGRVRSAAAFVNVAFPSTQIIINGLARNGETSVPVGLDNVIMLAAGNWHNLALRRDGTVFAWGMNDFGQCNVPMGLADVVAVACGGDISLALRKDGTVVAWGDNAYGQRDVPPLLDKVVTLAAGESHVLAVKVDGTVVAWGNNTAGQSDVPVGLQGIVAVAGGGGHSVALKANGEVVCWGANGNGQCNVPAGLGPVAAIATGAGSSHTLVLQQDGSLGAWGYGGFGNTSCPEGNDYVAISSTYNNLNALREDGVTVSWGHNVYGQSISGVRQVVGIASGAYRNLAISSEPLQTLLKIVSHPANSALEVGATLTLGIRVEGWPAPAYQWRRNGLPVTGANGSVLVVSGVNMEHSGIYDVEVSNEKGVVLSDPALVQIELRHPVLAWVQPAAIQFGVPLGAAQLRATSTTAGTFEYNFPLGTILPVGTYFLTADFQPADPSTAASDQIATLLSVNAVSEQPIVTGQPESATATAGAGVSFTVNVSSSAPLLYYWQVSAPGSIDWTDLANGGVYSGVNAATLTITGATAGLNGNVYRCVIFNAAGHAVSEWARLTVTTPAVAPTVGTHPASKTVTAGGSTTFTVGVSGSSTLLYYWQVSAPGSTGWTDLTNSGVYSGANTATLTITGATAGLSGNVYRCVIFNPAGHAVSEWARLTVTTPVVAPTVTTPPANRSVTAGGSTSFSVVAGGTAPLLYFWQESAPGSTTWTDLTNGGIYSGVNAATLTITGATAGLNGNVYRCVIFNAAGHAVSEWARLTVTTPVVAPTVSTPPANKTVTAGGSTSFTVGVSGTAPFSYYWQVSVPGSAIWADLVDNSIYSGTRTATLQIAGAASGLNHNSYRCQIFNSAGYAVSDGAVLTVTGGESSSAPVILAQPDSITATEGTITSFMVGVSGTAPFSYYWQVSPPGSTGWTDLADNAIRTGSNTSVLTQVAMTGLSGNSYRCQVFNTFGYAVSESGVLTVTDDGVASAPIIITQPGAIITTAGANASFAVEMSGTAPFFYYWQVSAPGSTSWTDLANSGVYSGVNTSILTITGATTGLSGNVYRCVIFNPVGHAVSEWARLTVTSAFSSSQGSAPTESVLPGDGTAPQPIDPTTVPRSP